MLKASTYVLALLLPLATLHPQSISDFFLLGPLGQWTLITVVSGFVPLDGILLQRTETHEG